VTGGECRIGFAALLFVVGFLPHLGGCSRSEATPPRPAPVNIAITFSNPKPVAAGLAAFEPETGCMIGAYIDKDPLLTTYRTVDGREHADPLEFDAITGKKHAMYFFYQGYGRPLPKNWVAELKARAKVVHIALEPNNGLEYVRDDEYLNNLAKDMAQTGATIFLRYASEMNGAWVAYGGNPRKYIEKWRIVHRVMKRHAPNVVLVWCPYTTPRESINDYYPGDAYVDWVGVNMYNVTYFNQNPRTPAMHVKPTDMLDQVYRTYSSRKPIMICEYGVTNFSALENRPVIDYAVKCITDLYAALPVKYPRVKCINYFNANALLISHRRNNDYSVTSHPRVLEAYRKAISNPYFLSKLPSSDDTTPPAPIGSTTIVHTESVLRVTGAPVDARLVVWAADRKVFDGTPDPSWSITAAKAGLSPGLAELRIEAFDTNGLCVANQSWQLRIAN
jgi:hypothetical protein